MPKLPVTELTEESQYQCYICKEWVKGWNVAAWVRVEPRVPFDPQCHSCLREIYNHAMQSINTEEFVTELFNL